MFACDVRSARERSFEEVSGETEVVRCLLLPPLALALRTRHCGHATDMQTEPQLEAATSAGVILPETVMLDTVWQELQRYHQTHGTVRVF